MRLHKRLQKTMAVVALATTTMTAMPVLANDYKGHWAEAAIEKWSQEGVIKGYEDGSFKPKNAVTRAELAAIISRVFGLESTNGAKSYSDVSLMKWYAPAIKLVSAAGIMNDNGEMFRPEAPATREEAAYAIAQAYHVTGGADAGFKDADKISSWAVDEVAALVAGGYINGRPDGTFAPADTLTRADLVVMIDKITAELINEAGTVNKNVKGNVVVNTKDVVLKDMTIDGNLYIAEGVADGNVELNNVKVTGSVIVEGGGMNSVKVLGKSEIPTIVVNKSNDKVRLEVGKEAIVALVELVSGAKLDGTYANVVVKTAAPITVGEKAKVEKMAVTPAAAGVKIDLGSGSEIKTLEVQAELKVTGKGKIKLTTVVDGVDGKKVSIPKNICDKVVDPSGKEVEITRPSTGGGGGGGGGTGGQTQSNAAIELADIMVKTADDIKLINVSDNDIEVTYNTDGTITVDGEVFGSDEAITEVILHPKDESHRELEVKVGHPAYNVTLRINEIYEVDDRSYGIAAAQRNQAVQLLGELEAAGHITADQKTDLVKDLDGALKAFKYYTTQGQVPVSYIVEKLETASAKFDDPNWQVVYAPVFEYMEKFGVIVNVQDRTITGTVSIMRDKHKTANINVTINF